ncbi:hypothetical protein [Arthrobacter sp. BE255]|uniref:hypothetical protein n=1 Tax=Arthrobacter sp. BE255 TaxID=2817721 RepID=UPI0028669D34|nr:hypothetical protein [Arthrobacter sp. BE255]MDR7161440.1 hypothetical protein [Arthrobacter sp. BE255]
MITALQRALRQRLSAAMAAGLVLAVAMAALLIPSTPAQAAPADDDRVKATYLIESEWVRVRLAAQRALDTYSPAVIREFLRYEQYLAAAMDTEEQVVLRLTANADSASLEARSQRLAAESALAQAGDPQHATASAASARAAADAARTAAQKAAEAVGDAVAVEKAARTEDRSRLGVEWAFRTAEAKAANTAEDAQLAAEAQARLVNPEPYPAEQQIIADRQRTYQYQARGGAHVRSSAESILLADDPLRVREFLVEGVLAAEELDNRIAAYWLLETGGPETRVGADVAIDGTREMLRALATTDQFRFADRDREKSALVSGLQARISRSTGQAAQAESDALAAEAAAVDAAARAASGVATPPVSQPKAFSNQAPDASRLGFAGGTVLNAGVVEAGALQQVAPALPGEIAGMTDATPAGPAAVGGKPASGTTDAGNPASQAESPQAAETRAGQGGRSVWMVLLVLGVIVLGGIGALVLHRRRSLA